jgi:hypothetical protein
MSPEVVLTTGCGKGTTTHPHQFRCDGTETALSACDRSQVRRRPARRQKSLAAAPRILKINVTP